MSRYVSPIHAMHCTCGVCVLPDGTGGSPAQSSTAIPFVPLERVARPVEPVSRSWSTDRLDHRVKRDDLVGNGRSIVRALAIGLLAAAVIAAANLLPLWWLS